MFSGGMVYLLGALVAALGAAGVFFKLWRVSQAKVELLKWQVAKTQELLAHAKRLQDAVDRAEREGEEREQRVVEEVRDGRRDHLDNSG